MFCYNSIEYSILQWIVLLKIEIVMTDSKSFIYGPIFKFYENVADVN